MVGTYYKYFKTNARIYNSLPTTQPLTINPLTGQPTRIERLTVADTTEYLDCIVEFQRKSTPVTEKKGLNAGESILQGRAYKNESGISYLVGNNTPPWYVLGNQYICQVDFLGIGRWYATEQLRSFRQGEKYFGYPICGVFLRLEDRTVV